MYGLLALNAVLLVALGAVTFSPSANAQARVRGRYTAVAGGVNGALADVCYIVDTVHAEMIAVGFEPSQRELFGVGYRNLRADALGLLQSGSSR